MQRRAIVPVVDDFLKYPKFTQSIRSPSSVGLYKHGSVVEIRWLCYNGSRWWA